MEAISELYANWRQVGSIHDRDGCGEDYDYYVIGRDGVVLIEKMPSTPIPVDCFKITYENGDTLFVFNPNKVKCSPFVEIKTTEEP